MLEKQDETIKEISETRKHLSEKIDKTREELKDEIRGVSSKLDKTNELLGLKSLRRRSRGLRKL
jgi:uncharacterized coiled-coil DUF342 family protein